MGQRADHLWEHKIEEESSSTFLKKIFKEKGTNRNRTSLTSVAAALYPSCVASTSRASRQIPTDGRMDKGKESEGGGKECRQAGNHPPAATPSLSLSSHQHEGCGGSRQSLAPTSPHSGITNISLVSVVRRYRLYPPLLPPQNEVLLPGGRACRRGREARPLKLTSPRSRSREANTR